MCMRRCTNFQEQNSILVEHFGKKKEQRYSVFHQRKDRGHEQADETNQVLRPDGTKLRSVSRRVDGSWRIQ